MKRAGELKMAELENEFGAVYEAVRAGMLPFESWEKLQGESAAAFAAFCVFRDFGSDRNIKRAVAAAEADGTRQAKKYRVWRNWSTQFQWVKRAADYDGYIDKLKQTERRKTIEQREEAYREVTGKMLRVVNKKLDLMDAGELTQTNVAEWTKTAIDTEREVFGIAAAKNGTDDDKQLTLNFSGEFEGM
jgi:hypothetical protein